MTRRADGLQYGSLLRYVRPDGTVVMFGCDSNGAVFDTAADMQAWLTGQPAEEAFMAGLSDDQQIEMYQWLKRLSFGLDSATDTPFTERAELTHLLRSISTQARANGAGISGLASSLAASVADLATKATVSDTSASVLAAVSTVAAKLTDLQDAVAQLQPGGGGGAVSGTVSGSLTITPSA